MEKPKLRIAARLDEETRDMLEHFMKVNDVSLSEGIREMIRHQHGVKLNLVILHEIKKLIEQYEAQI